MVSEGDTATTTIDGVECDVTVESVNLEQRLYDDIRMVPSRTRVQQNGKELLAEPADEHSYWLRHEFRDIENSDWRIVHVSEGEHGPCVHLRLEDD